jgi:pyruvate kinase
MDTNNANNIVRRTKIVCTIGPATHSVPMIEGLLDAGMDVARINFSHGTHREHAKYINILRGVAKRKGLPLAIMQDLPGPKDRTGKIQKGGALLKEGGEIVLTTRELLGSEKIVSVDWIDLPGMVKPGDAVFLDDGTMRLEVLSVKGEDIRCRIITGGKLGDEKGVNVPSSSLCGSCVTEDDWGHLDFGIKHNVDFVALSFVSNAEDIIKVRQYLQKRNVAPMLIAKIERREALDKLDAILDASDGIMVARGDLGVEIPIQKVPIAQKQIINKCNLLGKPVIVATQMLESMVESPRPTRAEVTDVANAIFDGADAVMLSAETAIGQYPREAVAMMAQVAIETEAALPYDDILLNKGRYIQQQTDDAISYAACHIAHQLKAAAIIAFTFSGSTARRVSRYRPGMPILAITPNLLIRRQLALSWGVRAFKVRSTTRMADFFSQGAMIARESGIAHEGDLVVITGGMPAGIKGSTNLLKVHKV